MPKMVFNRTIIVADKLHPSPLSHVQFPLCEHIFQAFMVREDMTFLTIEIVSPYFQCKHDCRQFKIVGGIVLFMRFKLS